jgi:AcrR family transcriptional regulator
LNRSPRTEKIGGPGRPSLSFDKIIATALRSVEELGPQAFNMRMLAKRLRSGTATLYRHVASKAEILAYVVDRVLGEVVVDDGNAAGQPWQQACVQIANGLYRVLNAHPNVNPLLISQVPVGPNGLKARERAISVFLANGFPPDLAARAYTTVAHYVIGFAIQQRAGAPESQESMELRRFYRRLDAKTYPATIKVAEYLPGTSVDDEFHFGLKLIVDGLDFAWRLSRRAQAPG